MQYLLDGKPQWKPGNGPEYKNKLTRNHLNIVFQVRTRMIKVKVNYKIGQRNRGRNTAVPTRRMCRTTSRWVKEIY